MKKARRKTKRRPRRLTEKQEQFCRQILVCNGNYTEAYAQVYGRKASAQSTSKKASETAHRTGMQARLAELRKEAAASAGITKDEVMGAAAAIVRADLVEIMAAGPTVADLMKLPPAVRRTIKRLEILVQEGKNGEEGRLVKMQLEDRMRALELVGKSLGVFAEKVEHGVSDKLGELLEEIAKSGQGKLLPGGGK